MVCSPQNRQNARKWSCRTDWRDQHSPRSPFLPCSVPSAFCLVYLPFLPSVARAEMVAISAENSRRQVSITTRRSFGALRRRASVARNPSLVGTWGELRKRVRCFLWTGGLARGMPWRQPTVQASNENRVEREREGSLGLAHRKWRDVPTGGRENRDRAPA